MKAGTNVMLVLLIGMTNMLFGQQSYVLPEVEVSDSSRSIFHLHPDTKARQNEKVSALQAITSLIGERTHTFVRNYGPGRLATISQKGASPQQTAIMYKGFNMQNPTLGLTDVSLFSGFLFDRIKTGNNASALYGSGIVNNAIHLSASQPPDNLLEYRGMYGGRNHWFHALSVNHVSARSRTILKGYFDGARNDFYYETLGKQQKRLANAAHRQAGFLAEHHLSFENGHHLQVFGTHAFARREIPPTRFQSRSQAFQQDQMGRYGLVYQQLKKRRAISLRTIWMLDRINYMDRMANIDARNKAETVQVIGNYTKKWTEHAQALLQAEWILQNSGSDAHIRQSGRNQAALVLAYKQELPGLDAAVSISNRLQWNEFAGTEWLPFLELQYSISPGLNIFYQAQRTFRVPSLDDLFWNPGGNPDLDAETGWHHEIGLARGVRSGAGNHRLELSAYYRKVQNWIIWLPGNNQIWVPENIASVHSRGIEFGYSGTVGTGNFRVEPQVLYTYQNVTESHDDPAYAGRHQNQLIYMPEHQVRLNALVYFFDIGMGLHHRIVSSVYADPLNQQEVPGYQVSNLFIEYPLAIRKTQWIIRLSVDNLLNTEYEVVSNHPMPGRLAYFSCHVKF